MYKFLLSHLHNDLSWATRKSNKALASILVKDDKGVRKTYTTGCGQSRDPEGIWRGVVEPGMKMQTTGER